MAQRSLEIARKQTLEDAFSDFALPIDAIVRWPHSGLLMSMQDRWSIFGTSGSGKTTLAMKLFYAYARLFPSAGRYILNSKPDDFFFGMPNRFITNDLPPIAPPGYTVVWEPPDNDIDIYDAWFERLLKNEGPVIVLVDELSNVGGSTGMTYPLNFNRYMKQGRSLNKTLITLTQEAAYIPRNIMGQATHLVRMRLIDDNDQKRLDRSLHGAATPRRNPPTRYGLWHRRLDTPTPAKLYADWKSFLA